MKFGRNQVINDLFKSVHKGKPLGGGYFGGHLGYRTKPLLELGWEIAKSNSYIICGSKLVTRMRSLWGANANPHPQVFYPHNFYSTSHPWGMTQVTEWKFRLICFMSFICENTNKVWYKNLWNLLCKWHVMIFDLLTSPQDLQFDPRV